MFVDVLKEMQMPDFRSDTVTQPTNEMREAFKKAKVGDDVYGDDPTTNELERKACSILGKEAALFVVSGVMGNQLAIMAHTNKGEEVICNKNSHVFDNESGSAQMLSGVSVSCCENALNTVLDVDILNLTRGEDIHNPKTSLVCIENATAKGNVVPLDLMQKTYKTAKDNGLFVHLDGARIFNAAKSLGCDVKDIAKYSDSVMFCLSKGLCAPVGSIISGDKRFIEKCRKYRKMIGGGLRQSGIIASSGIIALEKMVDRLIIDNENAKYLAVCLSEMDGVDCCVESVDINIVFCEFDVEKFKISEIFAQCQKHGIIISRVSSNGQARFVTNISTQRESCEKLVKIIKGCKI